MTNKDKSTIDFTEHACLECGQRCSGRRSVGNHLNRGHGISLEAYVLKHFLGGVVPTCLCGCGSQVAWHKTRYHFSDFISGHNGGGFSAARQPTWTPEKVARRNEGIKRAHVNKKAVVKAKQAVIHQPMAVAVNWKGVADFVGCDEENVEELPLRPVVSAAPTPHQLQALRDQLVSILGADVVPETVMIADTKEGPAGFDVLVSSRRLLVKWDNAYEHGLDRDRDFDVIQLQHMADGFRQNRLAAQYGYELVRLPDTIDVTSILSIDDLVRSAYHHQMADGALVKDGMFRFRDDHHPLVTRDRLIRTNETAIFPNAPGRNHTEKVLKPALHRFLREYVRTRGWFYPAPDGTQDEALAAVRRAVRTPVDGTFSSLGSAGSSFLKSIFRSYWDVAGGPQESFWDDRTLDRVLAYRLGLNDSIDYVYTLDDGQIVSCKETFDINIKNVRYGFIVQRAAVSWFKPGAAASIYRHLLGDVTSPVVWDPSCGFGARLLGFIAAFPSGVYIGTDPAIQTFRDLVSLRNMMPDAAVRLHCQGSETFDPGEPLDLVFTSPPYFDREKYFEEESQCWKMFPKLESWRDGYLVPTLLSAHRNLKPTGKLAINIDQKNEGIVMDAAARAGFKLIDKMQLSIGRDHFSKKKQNKVSKSEPILVFSKV